MSQDSRKDADIGTRDGDVPEALRRRWRSLGDDEPPALVDQAVLNRARSAVEREAPHSSRPWSFGWVHTVTTAAVIVLGVTIVLQLGEPTPPPPAATREERSAPAEPAGDARQAPLRVRQQAPAAAPAAEPDSETVIDGRQAPREALRDTRPDAAADAAAEAPLADAPLGPDAWLAEIRALYAAGREAEARAELERFRQAWPDHPLPDDFPGALRVNR